MHDEPRDLYNISNLNFKFVPSIYEINSNYRFFKEKLIVEQLLLPDLPLDDYNFREDKYFFSKSELMLMDEQYFIENKKERPFLRNKTEGFQV
ncbi:hypothetical protein HDU92_007123 [Lobulomyces angularis]|nr:hypothetical protein HDU92_007123 [Lobulomyces angularis]